MHSIIALDRNFAQVSDLIDEATAHHGAAIGFKISIVDMVDKSTTTGASK